MSWKDIFFLHFFAFFFANLQFPGRTSGNAGEIQKTLGNLQKMQTICKQNAEQMLFFSSFSRVRLFFLQIVCIFFCKFPRVFGIFQAFPEVLPGNCKFAKKMRKTYKTIALLEHAANPM
jgi:hypothetical protein